MADNEIDNEIDDEIIWVSAEKIAIAINNLTRAIENQNRILDAILKVLNAK